MKFHYLSRGIISSDKKILLAHAKGASNTFLPGGHIEIGEKAELALKREIKEELGVESTIQQFIGAVEHTWPEHEPNNHEINLLFQVKISGLSSDIAPASLETHLSFFWSNILDLKHYNLQPFPLIDGLSSFNEKHKGYWGTSL